METAGPRSCLAGCEVTAGSRLHCEMQRALLGARSHCWMEIEFGWMRSRFNGSEEFAGSRLAFLEFELLIGKCVRGYRIGCEVLVDRELPVSWAFDVGFS